MNATDCKHLTDLVVTNGGGCVGFDANLSQNAVREDGAADMLTVCHRSAVCLPPSPTISNSDGRATSFCYPIDTMNAISRDRNRTNGLGVGAEGDASYQLTASHSHAVAVCYDGYNQSAHAGASMTLRSAMTGHDGNDADPKIAAVFKIRGGVDTYTKPDGKTGTAGKGLLMSDEAAFTVSVAQDQQLLDGGFVRRLTPTECETLQGFPRGWTDVPYRGAPASDAARFKGLGNSWATNCAEWILRRLVASDVFKE